MEFRGPNSESTAMFANIGVISRFTYEVYTWLVALAVLFLWFSVSSESSTMLQSRQVSRLLRGQFGDRGLTDWVISDELLFCEDHFYFILMEKLITGIFKMF